MKIAANGSVGKTAARTPISLRPLRSALFLLCASRLLPLALLSLASCSGNSKNETGFPKVGGHDIADTADSAFPQDTAIRDTAGPTPLSENQLITLTFDPANTRQTTAEVTFTIAGGDIAGPLNISVASDPTQIDTTLPCQAGWVDISNVNRPLPAPFISYTITDQTRTVRDTADTGESFVTYSESFEGMELLVPARCGSSGAALKIEIPSDYYTSNSANLTLSLTVDADATNYVAGTTYQLPLVFGFEAE